MSTALEQIPDDLRASGVPVDTDPAGHLSWDKQLALRVLEALEGTKVAVEEVAVYKLESWGPVETDESWSASRLPGETASDHARKSRHWASQYIDGHDGDATTLYLVCLDDQSDAA